MLYGVRPALEQRTADAEKRNRAYACQHLAGQAGDARRLGAQPASMVAESNRAAKADLRKAGKPVLRKVVAVIGSSPATS